MSPTLFDLDRRTVTYACPACRALVTIHVPLSCPPSCTGAGRHRPAEMREEPSR